MRSERQSDGVGYRGRYALALTHNTDKQTKQNMTDQTRTPHLRTPLQATSGSEALGQAPARQAL